MVPDVNWISKVSSACTTARAWASWASVILRPAARKRASDNAAAGTCSPSTTRWCSSGRVLPGRWLSMCGSISRSMSTKSILSRKRSTQSKARTSSWARP
ncbi:hypothetical protein D3C79_884880 [compost metagenome]